MTTPRRPRDLFPPVVRTTEVRLDPAEAFGLFTDQIGAWWPLPTRGCYLAASAGLGFWKDRLLERSVDGAQTPWAEVLAWQPPHRLVLTWHPGRPASDQGASTEVEVRFLATPGGTRVELEHRGWERLGEAAGHERGHYVGPGAWGSALDHYADLVDRDDRAVDTTQLRRSYSAFFAEAAAGGFAQPAPGQWSPALVVAHVAVNDDLLAAVCRSLVHLHPERGAGGTTSRLTLDNAAGQDPRLLDAFVTAHGGDLTAMVATGRSRAAQVCALLERLDDARLSTPVHVRLSSDGDQVLDDELAWSAVHRIQAEDHLPSHTEQVRSLR